MKQSEALDMITKIQLAHQAMKSAWKRVDELKEENKNLKEALAKQEQGEPVAVMELYTDGWDLVENINTDWLETLPFGTKLYTTPKQRKPLTKEELQKILQEVSGQGWEPLLRAIEAAHGIKEKNT
jgi:hypothetical protein